MNTQERAFLIEQCHEILEIMTYMIETEVPDGNIIFSRLDRVFKDISNEINMKQDEYEKMIAIKKR
jgi:hypothetical protein